jgi:oxygen-independent coproporphyrinogen-3 oxidase
VALGITAIGDLQGAYVQNVKKLPYHADAVRAGRFPVEKGFLLSEDDLLRRHVIRRLMCDSSLDIPGVEDRFGIVFDEYFVWELEALGPHEREGLVVREPDRILLTPLGRIFVRNVCMVFDWHLRNMQQSRPVFSRTV